MENPNETIQIDSIDGTDIDHRRKCAIALAKRIQCTAENLAKYLQTDEQEHQQLNQERRLEEEQMKALKIEISKKNAQLDEAVKKEIQIRRIAEKYKDSSNDLEVEVQVLKNELAKKKDQLAVAVNKELQIRRTAKKYKDWFHEMESKVNDQPNEPEQNSNGTKLAVELENVESLPNDNLVSLVDLLEQNQERIAALTASNPLTNVQHFEVVDVIKRWNELDAKMKQIIDRTSKRVSDVVPDHGGKRHRDSDGDSSTSNIIVG